MDVTLKIEKKGHARGTIGWLCENAATIHLGQTQNGKPGAWLLDHEGKVIDVLAVAGFWGDVEGLHANNIERSTRYYHSMALAVEIPYSDAAWRIMQQIQEIAVKLLCEPEELAEKVAVAIVEPEELAEEVAVAVVRQ